jgi:AcrR family transcriptional regulator
MCPKADEGRGRRADRAREDVLLAAARAFGRIGLARTTMADIAGEAGYTVPSLYAYYGSKDEIVDALGALFSSDILAVFDDGFPSGLTTRQRVELLLRRLFAMTERRREILAVFFALPVHGGNTRGIDDGYEITRLRLSRWFRENEGLKSRRTADELAMALLGLCDAVLRRWDREKRRTLLVSQASVVADLFLNGAQARLAG